MLAQFRPIFQQKHFLAGGGTLNAGITVVLARIEDYSRDLAHATAVDLESVYIEGRALGMPQVHAIVSLASAKLARFTVGATPISRRVQ